MQFEGWFAIGDSVIVEPHGLARHRRGDVAALDQAALGRRRRDLRQQLADPAVRVLPRGVREVSIELVVRDEAEGRRLFDDAARVMPVGPTQFVRAPWIEEVERLDEATGAAARAAAVAPGREWLADGFLAQVLQESAPRRPDRPRPGDDGDRRTRAPALRARDLGGGRARLGGRAQLRRATVQRPPCACSSVTAERRVASMRQNASSGAPRAWTTAAFTTSPCVIATTRPSSSSACASSQRAIRAAKTARLSPPCGEASGSSIQARTASGSSSLTSASERPAHEPKSHAAIASSTRAREPCRLGRLATAPCGARDHLGAARAAPRRARRPARGPCSSSCSSAGNAEARVAEVGACRTSSSVRTAQRSSSLPAAMRGDHVPRLARGRRGRRRIRSPARRPARCSARTSSRVLLRLECCTIS